MEYVFDAIGVCEVEVVDEFLVALGGEDEVFHFEFFGGGGGQAEGQEDSESDLTHQTTIIKCGGIKLVIKMNTPKAKSRKKHLRLEDITYYSHNRLPSRSPTPTSCKPAARGIMAQALAERIELYKKGQMKKHHKNINELMYESIEKETKELRHSPSISPHSKKLYEQVKERRNLSPQVLVRFEQYEKKK